MGRQNIRDEMRNNGRGGGRGEEDGNKQNRRRNSRNSKPGRGRQIRFFYDSSGELREGEGEEEIPLFSIDPKWGKQGFF